MLLRAPMLPTEFDPPSENVRMLPIHQPPKTMLANPPPLRKTLSLPKGKS